MKYRLTIEVDECPVSPREWDNLGTFVGWHSRYSIGDSEPDESPTDYRANLPDDEIVLPVYMYDHGGVAYSTGAFGCPWDSGQVGMIHAPRGIEGLSDEMIQSNLRSEIEVYSQWASGDVWEFLLEYWESGDCGDDEHGDWHHGDSCSGFYGSDYRENGMLDHFPDELVAYLDNLTFPASAPCEINIPEPDPDPVGVAQARYDRACTERMLAATALIEVMAANPTRCTHCGEADNSKGPHGVGRCAAITCASTSCGCTN